MTLRPKDRLQYAECATLHLDTYNDICTFLQCVLPLVLDNVEPSIFY